MADYQVLSVVIPLAPQENAQHELLRDLEHLADIFLQKGLQLHVQCVSAGSRAKSLNQGAEQALKHGVGESKESYIWFLHADSRVTAANAEALALAIRTGVFLNRIAYFNLAFREGGLAKLNAVGANIRSVCLNAPYGDQGFCMSRNLWLQLGGYPEDLTYAEDLRLVLSARTQGVQLYRLPSTLTSSARKYQQQGWLSLTLRYQWIFWRLFFRSCLRKQ
ncbi:hypothetical protein CWE08_03585 [Aliidiomarina iranensis]|uniref:Glycosyl transferase family 2 n=1 Tax=Aliidiomarina iranensis TaxID=1434071 RepID=A0A432VZV3_9GAMM|nr:hypothetical protein [Aliidiomarina iranensis]RUO22281.1 hypothetical protein CWE08_03585 [Aliidiomarina iranensis]